MQKSKSKKRAISVKNKSSGSWVLYFALVLLLLVIAFFVFKGITGNVVFSDDDAVWTDVVVLNDQNRAYEMNFPSGVKLTGVRINWSDGSNNCKGIIQRYAANYGDDGGWLNITNWVDVPNVFGVNNDGLTAFWQINSSDSQFRIKISNGCTGTTIKRVHAWFDETSFSHFNYTYGNYGQCTNGVQTGSVISKVLSDQNRNLTNRTIPCSYFCNGTAPANATLCSGDSDGLTVNVTRTLKEDCSTPSGSVPKCEYTCNDGYDFSNGACVLDTTPTYTCNAPLFCNTTPVAHSYLMPSKTCQSGTCSNCSSGYGWNGSYCVEACDASPGCKDQISLANATNVSGFCNVGTCYECNDDYSWNGTKCVLQQCTSSPGCRNESSLANANNKTRFCAVGKCFACNSGYTWNNASSACLTTTGWSNISFTDAEFVAGTIGTFQVYSRAYFTFNSNRYWVGLISTDMASLTANVRIDPVMNKTLSIDVENKIDLNADGVSDIILRLDDVGNGEADIYIKKIVAVVQTGGTPDASDNDIFVSEEEVVTEVSLDQDATDGGSGSMFWVIILLVVLIIIIVLVIFFITRKKQEPMRTDTNNVVPANRPVAVQSPAPARPMVRPVQPMRQAVSSQGIQRPMATNVPISGDVQVAADIRKQIDIGSHFVVDGKILPAKAVYSKISEMYKTLKMPNDKLYSEIVDYYKKLVK